MTKLSLAVAMFSTTAYTAEGVKRPFQVIFQERQAKIECLGHGKIGNAQAISKPVNDWNMQSLPQKALETLEESCLATAADLSSEVIPEPTRHTFLKPLRDHVFLMADPRAVPRR